MKKILRAIRDLVYLPAFLLVYAITRKTSQSANQAMINMFCLTRGWSNTAISRVLAVILPRLPLRSADGFLGNLSDSDVSRILSQVAENGFYIYDRLLPPEHVERLVEIARTAPCILRSNPPANLPAVELEKPRGPRYDIREEELINDPSIHKLILDKSLLRLAQDYLGCRPRLDLVGMWWSFRFGAAPDAGAAQMYHFDMDRLKCFRMFVLLSDVTLTSGPHTIVRGTNRAGGIPGGLLEYGYSRLTDAQVQSSYPAEDIVEITGKKGTILFTDPQALHKGKVVADGSRLIFEIVYTNSGFGAVSQVQRVAAVPTDDELEPTAVSTIFGKYV